MRNASRRWWFGVAVGVAGLVAVPALAASATSGEADLVSTPPVHDVFVGVPYKSVEGPKSAGAVQLRPDSGAEPVVLTSPEPRAGARFGAAVGSVRLGGASGQWLILIGAPGLTVDGKAGAGGVYVFERTANGARFVELLTQDHPGIPGEAQQDGRFGTAIDTSGQIYVGAPGLDVGEADSAGGVFEVELTADVEDVHGRLHTLDVAGSPRPPKTGDRLGTVVYGDFWGAPGARISGQDGAGMVVRNTAGELDPPVPYEVLYQGKDGNGVSEAADHFGAAICNAQGPYDDPLLWVGVPGEDLDGESNAGRLNLIGADTVDSDFWPWWVGSGLNQDGRYHGSEVPGGQPVTGSVAAGNRFGASCHGSWHRFGNDGGSGDYSNYLLVGAPGADPHDVTDAGRVIGLGGAPSVTKETIGGVLRSGERFGTTVYATGSESTAHDVLIGAPRARDGAGLIAHGVQPLGDTPVRWDRWTLPGSQPGDGYGNGPAADMCADCD